MSKNELQEQHRNLKKLQYRADRTGMEAVNNIYIQRQVYTLLEFSTTMTNSLLNSIIRAFQRQFTVNLLYVVRDEHWKCIPEAIVRLAVWF